MVSKSVALYRSGADLLDAAVSLRRVIKVLQDAGLSVETYAGSSIIGVIANGLEDMAGAMTEESRALYLQEIGESHGE